jgi:hypothetical protein
MKLLRSLGWLLLTVCVAVLIVLAGGTLIRYGTVTRHHHMVMTNATEFLAQQRAAQQRSWEGR